MELSKTLMKRTLFSKMKGYECNVYFRTLILIEYVLSPKRDVDPNTGYYAKEYSGSLVVDGTGVA